MTAVRAQPRPDAGTLGERERQLPTLPPPGAPPVAVPPSAPARAPVAGLRIVPAAFRVEGSSVFDAAVLAGLLREQVGVATDLAGLQAAAGRISAYYRERGYLLTEAYLPEQAFQAQGGTVTIRVVEARVGRVRVRAEGPSVSAEVARILVEHQLRPGQPVTGDALDKPVLLLRDLSGYDASAVVEPGAAPGEVDVAFVVRAAGQRLQASLGLDNHGARAAGAARAVAALDLANVSGRGDALAARVQVAEITGTRLYRLAYTLSLGAAGTRATLAASRSEYALGRAFKALGASGHADVLSASLLHPFIRGREANLFGFAALERKRLDDETSFSPAAGRAIQSLRLGLLGNLSDGVGGGGFTSYAATVTAGHLRLDEGSLAIDQAAGGLRTAGSFAKVNLELQRLQLLAGPWSVVGSLQGQLASRNLASAEQFSLGGPAGVRAYAVGDATGDAGVLGGLELRYQWPGTVYGEPLSLSAFYEAGRVRFSQEGSGAANRATLEGAGIGLAAGRPHTALVSASLAWRTGGTPASDDRSPRLWLSTQRWF